MIFYAQIAVISGIMFLADTMLPGPIGANRIAAGIFVWLIGNVISSSLRNSGAFEIFIGEKLVWSSLAQGGKLPTYSDLVTGFAAHGIDLAQR